jgi:hypothetical protein
LVAYIDRVEQLYQSQGKPNWSQLQLAQTLKLAWSKSFDGHASVDFFSYENYYQQKPSGFKLGSSYPIYVYTTEIKPEVVSCINLREASSYANDMLGKIFVGYLPGDTKEIPKSVKCKTASGSDVDLAIQAKTENDAVKHTQDDKVIGAMLSTTSEGIDILKITSFPEPSTVEQRRIANLIANSDRPLIIDVRGVGGGAPEFNQLMQKALFAPGQETTYSKSATKEGWLKVLAVTQMYYDMDQPVQTNPAVNEQKKKASRDHFADLVANWEKTMLNAYASYNLVKSVADVFPDNGETSISTGRKQPRKSPVVLLTDRGCGSQCDFFVSAIRHLPSTKVRILGIPTAGRMNFGNAGLLVLPNSHLSIVTSIASNIHIPPASEGEGIQPDVFVNSDNAMSHTVSFIKQLF